ncbi:hypothetical protein KFU94_42340 [Chloroflexi bacterium TSY]|nr:hypothetical protein [Chloroflexi bacterium TSY]
MNIIRILLCTVASSLLVFVTLPQSAIGHGVVPTDGSAMMILEEYRSGPYIIEASQYKANDFVVLEVHLGFIGGRLPKDTHVEIAATSVQAGQSIARKLLQYQDAFIARLPLIDKAWQVAITVEGEAGSSSAEAEIMPGRKDVERSLIVSHLIFGAPFIFALIVLIAYKQFGILLISDNEYT